MPISLIFYRLRLAYLSIEISSLLASGLLISDFSEGVHLFFIFFSNLLIFWIWAIQIFIFYVKVSINYFFFLLIISNKQFWRIYLLLVICLHKGLWDRLLFLTAVEQVIIKLYLWLLIRASFEFNIIVLLIIKRDKNNYSLLNFFKLLIEKKKNFFSYNFILII